MTETKDFPRPYIRPGRNAINKGSPLQAPRSRQTMTPSL